MDEDGCARWPLERHLSSALGWSLSHCFPTHPLKAQRVFCISVSPRWVTARPGDRLLSGRLARLSVFSLLPARDGHRKQAIESRLAQSQKVIFWQAELSRPSLV